MPSKVLNRGLFLAVFLFAPIQATASQRDTDFEDQPVKQMSLGASIAVSEVSLVGLSLVAAAAPKPYAWAVGGVVAPLTAVNSPVLSTQRGRISFALTELIIFSNLWAADHLNREAIFFGNFAAMNAVFAFELLAKSNGDRHLVLVPVNGGVLVAWRRRV